MLPTRPELSKPLGLLYDAAAEASLWPVFLEELGRAAQSSSTAVLMHDLKQGQHAISIQCGLDSGALQAYMKYFAVHDIWLQRAAPLVHEGWVASSKELCSLEELKRTDFYAGYLKPNELAHAMWGVLESSSFRIINVGFYRSLHGPFGQSELDLLRFAPHFVRSFQLHLHLAELKSRADSLHEAMDNLAIGFILLGERGK